MVYIFAANVAVSLTLSIALWVIWRMDRQHLFARDVSLMQLAYAPTALGYFMTRASTEWVHLLGIVLTSASVAAIFTAAASASLRISDVKASRSRLVPVYAAVTLLYLLVLQDRTFILAGLFGCLLFSLLGVLIFYRLYGQGTLPRVIGACFVLVGINSASPALFGEELGLSFQFSAAIVIRTALCISIIFMALTRSRERETSALLRFQQLTDNSLQGVVVLDQQHIYYANAAALKMYGLTDFSEMQAAGPFIGITNSTVRDKSFVQIGRLIQGQLQQTSGEAKRYRKDGTLIRLQFTGWRTLWDGKQAAHILITDHTAAHQAALHIKALEEQREAERIAFAERIKTNLLQANSDLERLVTQRTHELIEASAAKDQFLANMSHELRTPMNAVLGMLKLVKSTELTDRQLDYVSKTESSAKALLTLLNDVLDFSRINAGRMELEYAEFSMETVLQELSVILALNAPSPSVEVLFDTDSSLPHTLVGDSFRLKQVLLNLCMNAIKFTEQGEVCLKVAVQKLHNNSVQLRFSVRDTGIGISPQHQLQIFNMFSQADSGVARRYGGTGLGLPIARQLVDLMGGKLTVSSVLKKGSTFAFDLTLKLPAQTVNESHPAAVGVLQARALLVLLVDDNAASRRVLGGMLQDMGHQVAMADSGAQALASLAQTRFDAILLDAFMPGMDGWQTLEQMRALQASGHRPPVMMLSAWGRESLVEHNAQQHQFDAFLTKPLTRGMLQDNLNMVASGRSNLRNNQRAAAQERRRLDGMRILLVEDNPINQTVASELLRGQGATVEVADNGLLCMQALSAATLPFDAVLMDMQMPVMDGCTATWKIRNEMQLHDLPIIAMTANTLPSDRKACMDSGMNAHVGKPFDLHYLVEVLVAHRHGMAQMLTPAPQQLPQQQQQQSAVKTTLDVPGALDRIGGDTELYVEILQAYVKEVSALPEKLDALVAAKDWVSVNRIMHSLKGNSSTVGAADLEAVAKLAEQASEGMAGAFEAGSYAGRVRESIAQLLPVAAEVLKRLRAEA